MHLSLLCARIGFIAFLLVCCSALPVHAEDQAPDSIRVTSFYGNYDVSKKSPGQHALSLRGPKMEAWALPSKPQKPYHIGVSFPHIKDSYWLAVNYGIMEEAARLGVSFTLLEAGGYDNLATQQEQLQALVAKGVDGIILGSISYAGNNDIVQSITEGGIPVIEVINDIEAPAIAAKALVSFYEMGFFAGEFVAQDAAAAGKSTLQVAFFPGPKGSGWADDTVDGFKAATEFFEGDISIVAVEWGDTGLGKQAELIKTVLQQHPDLDYVVGNAVAATVAPDILAETGSRAKVVGTYITPALYERINDGKVAAAPADMTVDQARIAVGMMTRLLDGEVPGKDFPFRAGPLIPVVTMETIADFPYKTLFGPKGFKPVFQAP